ncbi:phosphotriesterase-related protein [Actinoplanes lutulentus]|uniref:Phosphotriesterase-related protein n=1 Tax=Actinoplanes lutulentus TaxID=1287878 RepID=A0A327Z4P1_9ACTN|nr:phosphotriesterase-related protein [Actinoplanes lutulentus]MBB2943320.1 phosphotriesterase-related protein [Actinoplanes lutulentus]RAK28379.1 phosphotriesterase-related protein [Actinoplanes lutulentus]
MPTVETVRGPVPITELGPTLVHEHLISISTEFAKFYPELSWAGPREDVVDRVTAQVQAVRDRGITTILDCTAFFHGRDMDFVREVNDRVDINIIVSTGIYTFDFLPYHVAHRPSSPVADDMLTRMFLRDITVGIGDSGIKAQSIKVATDVEGITANNERILRAAAFASAETGVPITAHTHPADGIGTRIQEIFRDGGVDLRTVVMGHSGDKTDLDYLRTLMDNGSVIGSDRFGLYLPGTATLEERVDVIATLCDEGYADRIALSHDSVMFSDWGPPGRAAQYFPTWVPTHISDVVLPALRERGVTDKNIESMLVTVPASLFAGLMA